MLFILPLPYSQSYYKNKNPKELIEGSTVIIFKIKLDNFYKMKNKTIFSYLPQEKLIYVFHFSPVGQLSIW